MALSRDEIDFDARVLRFEGFRTKNSKPQTVHLSSPALAILERVPVTAVVCFSSYAATCFQNFSAHKRRSSTPRRGVTDWRLHDLRRTCVSGMARLGIAPHIGGPGFHATRVTRDSPKAATTIKTRARCQAAQRAKVVGRSVADTARRKRASFADLKYRK